MQSSRSVALTLADLLIWHHVLLTGLSLITVLFLGLFIQEMRRGRAPMIESNWGGIGGGGGGWRMSGSLAYLLGMLGTATLLIVLLHGAEPKKSTNPLLGKGAVEKKTAAAATPTASATSTPAPTALPEKRPTPPP